MALEQWEIDLRKQLQDSSYSQPKEKTWEDKLREQISNIQPPQPAPQPLPKPKKNNNVAMFAIIILVLLGAVVFAYNMKTGAISNFFKKDQGGEPSPRVYDQPVQQPGTLAGEVRQLRFDMERMRTENAAKYEEFQRRFKWDNDRITLLGMMHNENWLVIRNEGPNSSHYVYFGADWKVSSTPQYLELTQADKEFLERYKK